MSNHDPGYAPPRTFSPKTVQDIRVAKLSIQALCKKYDLCEIEARLLVQAETVDQFGRITE